MKSYSNKKVSEPFEPKAIASNWAAFQEAGLLWFINRILHVFGWAIAIKSDDKGRFICADAMRVSCRGFAAHIEDKGYSHVAAYLAANARKIQKEAKLDHKN